MSYVLLSPVHTHLLPPRSGGHNNNSNTGAQAKASWPYTANSAHQTKGTGKSSPGASQAFAKIPRESRWCGFWRKYKKQNRWSNRWRWPMARLLLLGGALLLTGWWFRHQKGGVHRSAPAEEVFLFVW